MRSFQIILTRQAAKVFLVSISAAIVLCSVANAGIVVSALDGMFDLIKQRLPPEFFTYDESRPVSFDVNDWPVEVEHFVRAERDGIPILEQPSLSVATLGVVGLTRSGELFRALDKTQLNELRNPLSERPDASGVWYKVKLHNGGVGWIIGEPQAIPGLRFASFFTTQRTQSQTVLPPTSTDREFLEDFLNEWAWLLFVVVGVVVLDFAGGAVLKAVRRTEENTEDAAASTAKQFESRLQHFRSAHPELPPLPVRPFEYEGWFEEAKKQFQAHTMRRSVSAQLRFMREVNELHAEYRKAIETRFEIDRIRDRAALEDLKLQAELSRANLDVDSAEHEAEARRKGYQLQSKEADVRLKEADVKLAKLEADKKEIENPPKTDKRQEKPRKETIADRIRKMEFMTREKERVLDAFLKAKGAQSREELEDSDQDIYDQIANEWDTRLTEVFK